MKYDFHSKSWTEIAQFSALRRSVIFLPVGATEAHGPHLPLATDSIISVEATRRACELLEVDGIDALVLPVMSYTVAEFAVDFPGTISVSIEAATKLIEDILLSLLRQRLTRICVVNSHFEPAHVGCIKTAIERVESSASVRVCFPDIRRRRWAERLTEEFRSGACHAGRYEGSLVLAATPHLVKEDIMRTLPANDVSLSVAISQGKTSFKQAGGNDAYFGRPAEATRQEGEVTYEVLASMLVESLREVYPELWRK